MENLFDNPTTLRDPKHFVGRRDELERIFGLIKNQQSISLVGPRRIGKTSLLTCLRSLEIQQECHFDGSRFLFFYLDLQTRSMKKDGNDFFEYLFDYICQTLKEQARILGCVVNDGLDEVELFNALLDEFQRLGLYPVLMIDAFDEVANYPLVDEGIFGVLRGQGGAGKVSYITASMDDIFSILRRSLLAHEASSTISSPFHNIFAAIRLKPLSLEDAQKLLVETSARGGLPFRKEEVTWVVQQAGTHPYLLQQVATLLFEAKRSKGNRRVDYKAVQKEAQRNLFSHFEDTWTLLNKADRQTLLHDIALMLSNATDRQSLSESSSAEEEDEELQENHESSICPEFYRSELFHNYLRDTGKLVESLLSKITADDFKHILAYLDDPEKLGQSELIRVPFINARIEQQQAIAPAMRGKIVRDVLAEALARMKGQGERIDEARGWIYYNILYYRYFMLRHNMSQNTVAGRLGFSERQYYRFFKQALQRFKNALLEMDAAATMGHND